MITLKLITIMTLCSTVQLLSTIIHQNTAEEPHLFQNLLQSALRCYARVIYCGQTSRGHINCKAYGAKRRIMTIRAVIIQ